MNNWFSAMLTTALYTIVIQNLVFNGAYGASEAMRASTKPRRFLFFAVLLTGFSTITSIICGLLDLNPVVAQWNTIYHMLLYAGVLVVVFLVVALLFKLLAHPSDKFMSTLGMAAINTLVLAIPYLNWQAGYAIENDIGMTLANSIGSGLGAGAAFVLASLLIGAGVKRVQHNPKIPPAFQGIPALLIYVSLISLAFLGLSSGSVFA